MESESDDWETNQASLWGALILAPDPAITRPATLGHPYGMRAV